MITVTWMDGRTQKYDRVMSYHEADGILKIFQSVDPSLRTLEGPGFSKELHLPLANIRVWSK